MRLIMNKRADLEEPEVTLAYREMTEGVKRVSDFVKSLDRSILCKRENEEHEVAVSDIFYIESVDKKSFVYCEKEVFQCSYRLYELEEMLAASGYVRVSKATLLNIEKLKGVKTLANSRLEAMLANGESVCVTRKYLKEIKEVLIRRNTR